MLAVVLALAAAVGFGGSDFTAGLASRGASVIRVTILAEATAAVLSLLIVPWVSPRLPSLVSVGWGVLGGFSGVAAAMALYLGFRHAAFSVASSLSAVGSAALSVVAGLLLGERPAVLSLAGIALGLPAIAAVSASPQRPEPGTATAAAGGAPAAQGQAGETPEAEPTPPARATTGRHLAGVGFGLAAGAGFALYYLCLNEAGSDSGLWPVLVATVAGLAAAVVIGAATRQLGPPPRRALILAAATGVIGVTGTAAFFASTHAGLLAVTAVITSLYPAVTILLARVLLAERLTPVRLAGLCLAAASVGLIAAGGTG